ncbi:site-specific integrase [Vibrio anguillarum]|uniref:site-specific integrase n=1 Tax=Vibrio anguillarum TaxID=55601 RepID=UPI0002F6A2B7|nr:site-specific integrase [Vibrio anguillarum]
MKKIAFQNGQLTQLKEVSKTTSFNGYQFDIYDKYWRLNREVKVRVEVALAGYDSNVREEIREALVYFAENKSASYTEKMCEHLIRYSKVTKQCVFNEIGLLAFKQAFPDKNDHDKPSTLRAFIRQSDFLGFNVIEKDNLALINKWRFKGRDKGLPVASFDPIDGPFSDLEHEAIIAGLDHAYAEGRVTDEEYSIVQLFSASGRRPIQIASLKIKDISTEESPLGEMYYYLSIPRAKQRGLGFRSSFRKAAFIESIGQVLMKHKQNVIADAERLVGRFLTDEERLELPLFPMGYGEARRIEELLNYHYPFFEYVHLPHIRDLDDVDLLPVLQNTDMFHCASSYLTAVLKFTIDKLDITSERTGKKLHVNAYRFRYTLGTRAAKEHCGLITVATLLDHSDTQHADVYIKNIPEFAQKISDVMSPQLVKYANAFRGKVVEDEAEAQSQHPDATRIPCREVGDDIGSCGTNSMCFDNAPVACYPCPKFRPWRHAPHHLVLRWLVNERDRIAKITDDLTVAAVNDRAIYAVMQVIMECEKKELEYV